MPLPPPHRTRRAHRRLNRLSAPLVLLAATSLVAACQIGAGSPDAHASFASGRPGGSGAGSTAASPTGSSSGPNAPTATDITLEFAGDVHFVARTAKLLNDPTTAFGPSITPLLSAADVTTLNLETAVTSRGTPQPKTFHFRTTPSAFDAVRAAGVDAVTIANNHILDYGRIGLSDTLAAANAKDFPVYGAGPDANAAWAPWITTVRGTRIAYLGVSDVQELSSSWIATASRSGEAIANNLSRTLAAIKAAHRSADIVVVFMHWGTEGDSCPNGSQKTLAKQMAAAGANIIIGSHVHTLQGSGWLGKTFVAYGMGNFLWYINSWSTETGVLKLTLHPGSDEPYKAAFTPAIVSGTGQPVIATGAKGGAIAKRYASLRGCAGLTAAPTP
ncbi:MAG TPA: CapA family protein [Micromonosporaceae bacterium]|nr:CapA family protein [Micromonosporaceae bacterium]